MGKLYIKPTVLRGVVLGGSIIGGNTGIGIGDLDDEEEDVFRRVISEDSRVNFAPSIDSAVEANIPLEIDPVMDIDIEVVPEVPTVLPELTEEQIDLS